MNRHAARHLAFVVSVLLCFFVYMGYRFWGRGEPEDAGGGSQIASVSDIPGSVSSESVAEPTRNDDAPRGSFSLAPPPGDGGSIRPGDALYPIGSVDGQASLTPPGGIPPPPSGSIEESGPGLGSITGLIPAPPIASPDGGLLTPSDEFASSSGEDAGALLPSPGRDASRGSDAPASPSTPPSPPTGDEGEFEAGAREDAASPAPSFPLRPSAAGEIQGTRPMATQPSSPRSAPPVPPATPPRSRTTASPATSPAAAQPSPSLGPAADESPATRTGDMPIGNSLRIYVVQPGDTLSRIATRELGSIALADNIFLLNRDVIADPDHLMAGVRIRLPIREALPDATDGGASEQPLIHRVRQGETLSSIAAYYYGSSSAWQFLHQANSSTLPNPNQLRLGMELIIPPYEE